MTPQSFGQRLHAGWQQVRSACAAHGGIRPETGFLEPEMPTGYPREVYDVQRDGRHQGLLVLHSTGEVTACLEGVAGRPTCTETEGGVHTLDSLRTLLEVEGYEVVSG